MAVSVFRSFSLSMKTLQNVTTKMYGNNAEIEKMQAT